jgi:hypothetical protein
MPTNALYIIQHPFRLLYWHSGQDGFQGWGSKAGADRVRNSDKPHCTLPGDMNDKGKWQDAKYVPLKGAPKAVDED